MGARYKTFDSTGVAPNGRLFAGDQNAIQDMKADSSDFAQTIDLATLRIGEAGLTLTRFGAGEAQIAGDLRVTKLLRGLEGIIPGAFTTTQRDALAAGRAPYGIAILNTSKNTWEWNNGTDVARTWVPFGATPIVNTLNLRPAANSVVPGTLFFATDQIVTYISDGSTWLRTSPPAGATMAWFAAAAPTGFVKYDGTNLPSSTGIYADLATHLGGVATPDTRGRVIVGQGTHADHDNILDSDGLAVGSRRMKHKHTVVDATFALQNFGAGTDVGRLRQDTGSSGGVSGPTGAGATVGPQTGSEPVDGPANITGLYIAKL